MLLNISGEFPQEGEPDISVLPPPEAYPTLLLVHAILHHSPIDHVPARSSAANLGCLLHPGTSLYTKHPSITSIISIYRTLSSI